ncbi:MAG: PfkB family carbohydrate kinase [Patescibacteria group bacterium]
MVKINILCQFITLKTIALTGAGDAYASDFLSAIIKNKDIVTAMCWGTANAGSVTQKIGAQKGLLSVTGVKKIIQKYPRITPKIF